MRGDAARLGRNKGVFATNKKLSHNPILSNLSLHNKLPTPDYYLKY